MSVERIHQEVEVTIELDKVFSRHDDRRLQAKEPVRLHSIGDVVLQRVSLPDNPREGEFIHHGALRLSGVGKAQGWGPNLALDGLRQGVHVVLVPQVVEHQARVDPLDKQDEVRGVGQLQGVDFREGEDTDVDRDLEIWSHSL